MNPVLRVFADQAAVSIANARAFEEIHALHEHLKQENDMLTRGHVQELTRYAWPGNVRELQNVIERAIILARGGALRFGLDQAVDPVEAPSERRAPVSTRRQFLEFERQSIVEALQKSGGKYTVPMARPSY